MIESEMTEVAKSIRDSFIGCLVENVPASLSKHSILKWMFCSLSVPPSAKMWFTQQAACPAERVSIISPFCVSHLFARGSKTSTVFSRVPEVPPSTQSLPPCAQAMADDRGVGRL